ATAGRLDDLEPLVIGVPMDVGDWVWALRLPEATRLRLLFEIYMEMPSSSLFFTPLLEYGSFADETRALFWQKVQALLTQPDPRWSQPLAYILWCDFFEHWQRVEEAWTTLVTDDADDHLLETVLDASGPVPFAWKERLYARLLSDKRWHLSIFHSLLFSYFD